MNLYKEDINLYESSIGRVFCYPSFTSTSLSRGMFTPTGDNTDCETVLLEIKQNGTKNAISVEEFAKNMTTFKKENHVNGQGREQQIYTKFAFDAKRIEKKKDVKESYSTEEQKPLRKKAMTLLI
jgi:hypothetical protein